MACPIAPQIPATSSNNNNGMIESMSLPSVQRDALI
jgi:hypothetical protein